VQLGAALIAAGAGLDLSDLSWRRSLVHDLAASQRPAHVVGLNGFFCSLLRSADLGHLCGREDPMVIDETA
jgi:hypothetical protein